MFRPALESLESRELFSADLLSAGTLGRGIGGNTESRPTDQMSLNIAVAAVNSAAQAVTIPTLDGSSKEAAFFHILPYIEQDNLYKLVDRARGVAVGDVNRDGADDLIASLAAADFNRDGVLDVTFDRDMTARDSIFEQIGSDRYQGIIAILIG